MINGLRETVRRLDDVQFPEGYAENALEMFATSPMIVTHGRTVVYSEGV